MYSNISSVVRGHLHTKNECHYDAKGWGGGGWCIDANFSMNFEQLISFLIIGLELVSALTCISATVLGGEGSKT